jgi:hypothetical protein
MFLDLPEFFSNTITAIYRPPVRRPINFPDPVPQPRPTQPRPINPPDPSPPRRPINDGDQSNPRRPINDGDPSNPRKPINDGDQSNPRRPINDDDIPNQNSNKRRPGQDADEIDNLNRKTESDLIKPTDSPEDVATKKTLLSQAGDFVANHPLLTITAAGLAYYMFTTGQSLPEAVSSLGLSAGNAVGGAISGVVSGIANGIESAISGLTGIPKEYVRYIWYVLLALLLYYLYKKIKSFFDD